MGAVDDGYLCALLNQAEDRGPGGPACSKNKNPRARETHAALERADDAGNIGIEAVELAVSAGAKGIACADAAGERVHIGEMRQDFLLEWHGDGDAVERQIADDGKQIVERLYLERKHDGVDVFAAKRRGMHERRKRVRDGVAGDGEDARGLIELIETVEIEERARRDLARSGLSAVDRGGKGEGGAGARAEDAADEALLAHGDADDVSVERLVLNHLEDGEIVGQAACGGDNFNEVGLVGGNALSGLVEAFGTAGASEVVRTDEEGGTGSAEGGTELGQLRLGALLGRIDFEIDDVAAGFSGFLEDFKLCVEGAGELAAKGLAPAGGDGRDVAAADNEGLDVGQDGGGLGQGVKTQLNERRVLNGGFDTGEKLGGSGPLDCDTQLSDTQAGQNRGRSGRSVDRVGDGERHSLQLTHIKGVSMLMQPIMCRVGGYLSTELGRGPAGSAGGGWVRVWERARVKGQRTGLGETGVEWKMRKRVEIGSVRLL